MQKKKFKYKVDLLKKYGKIDRKICRELKVNITHSNIKMERKGTKK